MSWVLGLSLTSFIVSIAIQLNDQGDTWRDYKAATGNERCKFRRRLIFSWGLLVLTGIASLVSYLESKAADPQEQSVVSISATAHIEARVTSTNVFWWNENGQSTSSQLNWAARTKGVPHAIGMPLSADKFSQAGSSDGRNFYSVEFQTPLFPQGLSGLPVAVKVKDFDQLERLTLQTMFLPEGTEVTGGRILIVLNASIVKEYRITTQTPRDFPVLECNPISISKTNGP